MTQKTIHSIKESGLWCLTPLSTISQLYRGGSIKERFNNLLNIKIVYKAILRHSIYIAELDCCQIIILSICVPSTHAYTHVLRLSLDLPYEKR